MNNLLKASSAVIFPFSLKIIFIVFASKYISKDIYGQYIILETLVFLFSQVFLSMPSQAFNRFFYSKNENEIIDEFRTLLFYINILSLFVSIIYFFYFFDFDIFLLVIILIYVILNNNISFLQQIFLIKKERKKYLKIKIIESFSKSIIPILSILYFSESITNILVSNVIGFGILYLIILFYLGLFKLKQKISENLLNYLRFSYPILFMSFFGWGISFSDRYFIEYFLDLESVGNYSILSQYAGLGQIIGSIFIIYVNPEILSLINKDISLSLLKFKKYLKSLLFLLIGSFFLILIIPNYLFEFFIPIFKEPQIKIIFIILYISVLFSVFQNAYSLYFIIFEKLHLVAISFLFGFIINILLNIWIKDHGIIMASLSTLISYFIINFMMIIFKKYNLNKINVI